MKGFKKTATLLIAFLLVIGTANVFGNTSVTLDKSKLNITEVGSYNSHTGFDAGGAEIVVYEPGIKQAYVSNGANKSIDILDFSPLATGGDIKLVKQIKIEDIRLKDFKASDITSVAVSDSYLVATVPADPIQNAGKLFIFDLDGNYVNAISTGSLPDMVTFNHAGTKILVANEGQPSEDLENDPVASITVVDINDNILDPTVTHVGFGAFSLENLNDDVKIIYKDGTSIAMDLEPEYISVAPDDSVAYITLQENNAIAELNLTINSITEIYPFGYKDHSIEGNELDLSDEDQTINISTWPVLSMYQPDGLDTFTIGDNTYIITANEGDAKDYNAYTEEVRVGDIVDHIRLDADYYEGYTQIQIDQMILDGLFDDDQLGRIKVTKELGKNVFDNYESLYCFGSRSITIWQIVNDELSIVYDSGSQMEKTIEELMPLYFNTNSTENGFDSRSDDKGPEPEDVKVGEIDGSLFAFVGLERMGGIMVYDVTVPRSTTYVTYINTRDYRTNLSDADEGDAVLGGNIAPEGLRFISEEDSPTGEALLIAAYEVSGTVSVFEISK